jgi:GNAT superfamily N-acetyltransferase
MNLSIPDGFAVRLPTMADLDATFDLIVASDMAEYGEPDYTLDELRTEWEDIDLEHNAWLVFAPDDRLTGFAAVSRRGSSYVDSYGYVRPEDVGRGVGSLLVRVIERRAGEMAREASAGSPIYLQNPVSGANRDACRLLEQHGYALARTFFRMLIDLDRKPTAPIWPEGIWVRPCLTEGDQDALYGAVAEALQDHWEHLTTDREEWERRKTRADFDPSLWFMIGQGETAIGGAVCSKHPDLGWITDLGVRRPWRRRGLGLALLHHIFGECSRRGIRSVALGVDAQSPTGATRLYERAGMRVVRHFAIYQKELETLPVAATASRIPNDPA